MKKYYLMVLAIVMIAFQGLAQEKKAAQPKADGPVLTLEKSTHDFGDIFQGDKVEQVFKFTNNGTEPLIITDIPTTCGCTQPEWPRQPIPPGGKGEIKVGFNSAGKSGKLTRVLKVISNSSNDVAITISTNILDKKPQ